MSSVLNKNSLGVLLTECNSLLNQKNLPEDVKTSVIELKKNLDTAINLPDIDTNALYENGTSETLPVIEDMCAHVDDVRDSIEDVLTNEGQVLATDVLNILNEQQEIQDEIEHENVLSIEERNRLKEIVEHPIKNMVASAKDIIDAKRILVENGITYQNYIQQAVTAIKEFPQKVNSKILTPIRTGITDAISDMVHGASNTFHSAIKGFKQFSKSVHEKVKDNLFEIKFNHCCLMEKITFGAWSLKNKDKVDLEFLNMVKAKNWGCDNSKGYLATSKGFTLFANPSPLENMLLSTKNKINNGIETIKNTAEKVTSGVAVGASVAGAITGAAIDDAAKSMKNKMAVAKEEIDGFATNIQNASMELHRSIREKKLEFKADCLGKMATFFDKGQQRLQTKIDSYKQAATDLAKASQETVRALDKLINTKLDDNFVPDQAITDELKTLSALEPTQDTISRMMQLTAELGTQMEEFFNDQDVRQSYLDALKDEKKADLDNIEAVSEKLAKKALFTEKVFNKLSLAKNKVLEKEDDLRSDIEFN